MSKSYKKVGILSFHNSNNYGGILQVFALKKTIEELGYTTSVVNFIPRGYRLKKIIISLGFSKDIFYSKEKMISFWKRLIIIIKNSNSIIRKFNEFRCEEFNLTVRVDKKSLPKELNKFDVVVVGSDQIWNPSQRNNPEYFLNYAKDIDIIKVSYAADSTTEELDDRQYENLNRALSDFKAISVRNEHSYRFVKQLVDADKEVKIVGDPTILFDFEGHCSKIENLGEYILVYVLGKEIDGGHRAAIERIKSVYGDIPVYSIKIPTMKFELSPFADKVFYDLDPREWITMFKNAKFIYTDSFHGVLFSLKYHKPFLAYYTEKLRATRFIDLGKRYGIDKYIVQNIAEIDGNKLLDTLPDFNSIDKIIDLQKKTSVEFLKKSLSE